jgi:hypothetical protein
LRDEAPGIAAVGGFPTTFFVAGSGAVVAELVAYYNARTEIPFAKIAT